jgi:hypothetical protein
MSRATTAMAIACDFALRYVRAPFEMKRKLCETRSSLRSARTKLT